MADLTRGHETASPELLRSVVEKGRVIAFAREGSDDLRYLDSKAGNANVGGATLEHILLREDARTIEVWEEFLHGTQYRCGVIDRLGFDGAEVHVKEFMIRHQRLMRLSAEDVEVLGRLLKGG
jgi:hypothetical protein